ncbi:hypothetical protein R1sor_025957 [Riccia sorocarpa]|uniref:Uncharacterized protein n=1 Tax=Riccia sorocarpa TaxID=122646 RepID=A0ABD3GFQ0_9MARC
MREILENKVKSLEEKVAQLVKEKEDAVKDLEEQLERAHLKVKEKDQEVEEERKRSKKLDTRVKDLARERDNATTALEKEKSDYASQGEELKKKEHELQKLHTELAQAREENVKLREKTSVSTTGGCVDNGALQKELAAARAEVELQFRRNVEMGKLNSGLEQRIEELQEQLNGGGGVIELEDDVEDVEDQHGEGTSTPDGPRKKDKEDPPPPGGATGGSQQTTGGPATTECNGAKKPTAPRSKTNGKGGIQSQRGALVAPVPSTTLRRTSANERLHESIQGTFPVTVRDFLYQAFAWENKPRGDKTLVMWRSEQTPKTYWMPRKFPLIPGLESFQFEQSLFSNFRQHVDTCPEDPLMLPEYLRQALGIDHGSSYNPITVECRYLFSSIRSPLDRNAFLTDEKAREFVNASPASAVYPFLPRPTLTVELVEEVYSALNFMRKKRMPRSMEQAYKADWGQFRIVAAIEWYLDLKRPLTREEFGCTIQDYPEVRDADAVTDILRELNDKISRLIGDLKVKWPGWEQQEDQVRNLADVDPADLFDDILLVDRSRPMEPVKPVDSEQWRMQFPVAVLQRGTCIPPNPIQALDQRDFPFMTFDCVPPVSERWGIRMSENWVTPSESLLFWLYLGNAPPEATRVGFEGLSPTGLPEPMDMIPTELLNHPGLDLQVPRRRTLSYTTYGKAPYPFPVIPGKWGSRDQCVENLEAFGMTHRRAADVVLYRSSVYCLIIASILKHSSDTVFFDPNRKVDDAKVMAMMTTANNYWSGLGRTLELAVSDDFLRTTSCLFSFDPDKSRENLFWQANSLYKNTVIR